MRGQANRQYQTVYGPQIWLMWPGAFLKIEFMGLQQGVYSQFVPVSLASHWVCCAVSNLKALELLHLVGSHTHTHTHTHTQCHKHEIRKGMTKISYFLRCPVIFPLGSSRVQASPQAFCLEHRGFHALRWMLESDATGRCDGSWNKKVKTNSSSKCGFSSFAWTDDPQSAESDSFSGKTITAKEGERLKDQLLFPFKKKKSG